VVLAAAILTRDIGGYRCETSGSDERTT